MTNCKNSFKKYKGRKEALRKKLHAGAEDPSPGPA